MRTRIQGSERTREALNALMDGRARVADAKSELVRLATRLIIEEGLEGEVRDALGRDDYEHGSAPGGGYRNGTREGHLKTAEGRIDYAAPQVAGTVEPFRSELRAHLKGHSEGLEDLAVEMLARGLSVRDIEYDGDYFKHRFALEVATSAFQLLFHRFEGPNGPIDIDRYLHRGPEMVDLVIGTLFHYDPPTGGTP